MRIVQRIAIINPRLNKEIPMFHSFTQPNDRYCFFSIFSGAPNYLTPLGLLKVAALTPSEIEVDYFDENFETLDYQKLSRYKLVGITGITPQAQDIYRIAGHLRELNVITVCGGPHATVATDEVANNVDCVVKGEAETEWKKVISDFFKGRLKKVYEGKHVDLSSSPLPRYDLLKKYSSFPLFVPLVTSAGCSHGCEFCSAELIQGTVVRRANNSTIHRDLEEIKKIFGNEKKVLIVDDNLINNKKHGQMVTNLLLEFGLRFLAQGDVTLADADDLLLDLARSKCFLFQIGFESLNEDNLAGLNPNHWKKRQSSRYRYAIKKIQSYGIPVQGSFIVGMDYDNEDVFQKLFDFIIETELSEINVGVPIPLPKTKLYERLRKEGRMIYEPPWSKIPTRNQLNPVFQPKKMTTEALREGLLWLLKKFYVGEEAQKRKKMIKMELVRRRLKFWEQ